jgi:hypothetical protein
MIDDSSKFADGGCVCGAVRYRVRGRPDNTMVCHCRTCRRIAAAPVVAWITFASDRFELLRGEPTQFKSSDPVVRTFCAQCGTPLTYEHRDRPGFIDVTTCSLDDPNLFPPTHHSWLGHDLRWVRFGDDLPTFQESRQ